MQIQLENVEKLRFVRILVLSEMKHSLNLHFLFIFEFRILQNLHVHNMVLSASGIRQVQLENAENLLFVRILAFFERETFGESSVFL